MPVVFNALFFINSILLGVGLSMDAFSVSLANGLNEPCMKKRRMCAISGMYAFFQALMPMTGWVCVHTVVEYFTAFGKFIPWIALVLLSYIGGKMIYESFHPSEDEAKCSAVTLSVLLIQGVATSIDALSVGFTIADYRFSAALVCSLIIAAVTFVLCFTGLLIGRKAGTKLSGHAEVLGGIILIAIGIEIFIKGL
ncbi:MAG: manganese efflux pump MntP family protein [Treponema porcinum]|nr:manganese efflux pump MntP family protein [Treponema porcinum]